MKPREFAFAGLLILLQVALTVWIFMAPFTWILRDGLGPDSVESHGWKALWRAFSFLNWGPVLLVLLLANGLCKMRAPQPDEGQQRLWVPFGGLLLLSCAVALMFRS